MIEQGNRCTPNDFRSAGVGIPQEKNCPRRLEMLYLVYPNLVGRSIVTTVGYGRKDQEMVLWSGAMRTLPRRAPSREA